MSSPVSQSIGGSGGGSSCCCTSWANRLCYSEEAGVDQLIFRENNIYSSFQGTWTPYTWSPDAPYDNVSVGNPPAYVHGAAINFFQFGGGFFDLTFTTFYSWQVLAGGSSGLQASYLGSPANPVQSMPPTIMFNTALLGTDFKVLGMAIRPTTGICYALVFRNSSSVCYMTTVNLSTGEHTFVTGAQFDGSGYNTYTIGFDQAGIGYWFNGGGECGTISGLAGQGAVIWDLGTEYVYHFGGNSAGTVDVVCTYESGITTYRNRKIVLATGVVSDTITGEQRGFYYSPLDFPEAVTTFTRTFTVDCDDVLTTTDRDSVTGDIIVIPDGATVGECA